MFREVENESRNAQKTVDVIRASGLNHREFGA